jgi:hypothetical protein
MKRVILAALVAGAFAVPAFPQTATTTATPVIIEEPITVPTHAPPGSSTPGAMAAGGAAALVIVVLGIAVLSSLAFMP